MTKRMFVEFLISNGLSEDADFSVDGYAVDALTDAAYRLIQALSQEFRR